MLIENDIFLSTSNLQPDESNKVDKSFLESRVFHEFIIELSFSP